MVSVKGLGHEVGQAKWASQGQGRRRAQARGHPASHVDRWNSVYLVEQGGRRVTNVDRLPQKREKNVPARTMAVVRSSDFLRALEQRDRDCNIDPPTSSYAIMRRARPYRGENSEPGRDDHGELDTQARN